MVYDQADHMNMLFYNALWPTANSVGLPLLTTVWSGIRTGLRPPGCLLPTANCQLPAAYCPPCNLAPSL